MTPKRKQPDLSTYSGRCGERLRTLREKAGLAVEDVAQALQVSCRAIYHWESGERDPPLDILPQLARLFGLKSPQSLLAKK